MKFGAAWCQPCKRQALIFANIKSAIKDVDFEEVDVDECPDLAAQFKIMSIPTLVFVKDGVEIDRVVGLAKAQDIIDKVGKLK